MAYEAAGIGGKGPLMIGIIWFEIFLGSLIIGLRLWTRKFVKGKIGWDDVCLVATQVRTSQICILELTTNPRTRS